MRQSPHRLGSRGPSVLTMSRICNCITRSRAARNSTLQDAACAAQAPHSHSREMKAGALQTRKVKNPLVPARRDCNMPSATTPRASKVEYINNCGRGVDLFCNMVSEFEPRLRFLRLPYHWPATVLFRYADASARTPGYGSDADGEQKCSVTASGNAERQQVEQLQVELERWLPIRLRTTQAATDRRGPKTIFEFSNRAERVALHEFFISLVEKKLFLRAGVTQTPSGTHARFEYSDAVDLQAVVSRLKDVYAGAGLGGSLIDTSTSFVHPASKHDTYRKLQQFMSPQTQAQCRVYVALESAFYSTLGFCVVFQSLVAGVACAGQVGPHNVLHRFTARQFRGCGGKIIRYSAFGGTRNERPYLPEDVADLHFVCVADLPHDDNMQLRGFYMLPKELFDDMLRTPGRKGRIHCVIYSPTCSPSRAVARAWQMRCVPFYITAAPEERHAAVQKLKNIFTDFGRGSTTRESPCCMVSEK